MREHVKIEVALEILSICMSIAMLNNDSEMIEKILKTKQKIYLGNIKDIEEIIEKYGKKVKNVLEESDE